MAFCFDHVRAVEAVESEHDIVWCHDLICVLSHSPSKDPSYLNALKPCLDPQLLHQFPGLGDVVSGGHTDPSDSDDTGGNCKRPR